MTTARWARATAGFSAVTLVLFVLALLTVNERAAAAAGQGVGPYAEPLRRLHRGDAAGW